MSTRAAAQAGVARAAVAVQETPELRDVLRFDFPSERSQAAETSPRPPSRSAALRAKLARWLEQPL